MPLSLSDIQNPKLGISTSSPIPNPATLSGYSIGQKPGTPLQTPSGLGGINNQIPTSQDALVPTSTVSAAPAIQKVQDIRKTVDNQNATNTNQKLNTYDANNPNKKDANGLLLNPPGALFDRNTGNSLSTGQPPATTSTTATAAPTLDDKIANAPDEGNQEAYNLQTGQREDQPIGALPNGYSAQDPTTRKDVSNTVSDTDGNTYKQFSDGTYSRTDASGNYSQATASAFSAAQDASQVSDKIKAIQNGTFVLPPNQQSQLDAINSKYQMAIKQVQQQNDADKAFATASAAVNGIAGTGVSQASISSIVNNGIDHIADLVQSQAGELATMTASLEKEDYEQLQTSYDNYLNNQKDIQSEMDKTQATIQAQQNKQDIAFQAYALQQSGKYGDAGILPTDTPTQVDAKKAANSAIYQQEVQTKSGTVDQNVLDGMLKIYNKTGAIPAGMGNASVELKKAFYAAIGGAPALADNATTNKAALGAATKALSTQENQYEATQTAIGALKPSMDRVEKYVQPLVDSGSPLLNQPLRYISGQILGNSNYTAFENEINTVANEYAKILNGATASISGTSVQSVEDIKKAFNDNVNVGQLETVLDAMKQDVNARALSQQGTINQVTKDIKDIGTSDTTSSSASSAPSSSFGGSAWN